MQVQAMRQGYYAECLREPGDIFEMDEATFLPKDEHGKPYLRNGKPARCTWVLPLNEVPKAKPVVSNPKRPPGAGPMPGTLEDKAAIKEDSAPVSDDKPSVQVLEEDEAPALKPKGQGEVEIL